MGNRAHHGLGDGWRSVFDPELWRRELVIGTMGAASMAMLACAVALAHDTTGHDWYAAYKITVADLMIGAGFDGDAPVEYRNADGAVETVSRFGLTHTFEARWARKDILEAAWEGATLGALSGFGGALLSLVLIRRSTDDRRSRRPANETAPDRRPEARDRLAPAPERPAPMSAPAGAVSAPPPRREFSSRRSRGTRHFAVRRLHAGPAHSRRTRTHRGKAQGHARPQAARRGGQETSSGRGTAGSPKDAD